MNQNETCIACGAEPKPRFNTENGQELPRRFPMVAVLQRADLPKGREPLHEAANDRGREFVSAPICPRCYNEPRLRPGLKAHFFERGAAKLATTMAGTDGDINA